MQNEALKSNWQREMLEVKQNVTVEELCKHVMPQYVTYINYVRNMKFDEKPNYKMLRELFLGCLADCDIKEDAEFDWI